MSNLYLYIKTTKSVAMYLPSPPVFSSPLAFRWVHLAVDGGTVEKGTEKVHKQNHWLGQMLKWNYELTQDSRTNYVRHFSASLESTN